MKVCSSMKVVPFVISAVITVALVILLNWQWGSIPPVGKFLSPQVGFWQNAEPINENFNAELKFPQLMGKAEVYFDERLVPHVFAEGEEDAYFIQGYLHAKFRLWQMEFGARAAAGRISEILGEGPLQWDRSQRRLGMVYAAEKMVEEINMNPDTKMQCNAYTAGVNAYIDQLKESQLPLEFKLLNYKPEHWTTLKSALFLKYMAEQLDLTDDLAFTNAHGIFTQKQLDILFPAFPDLLIPVVPDTPENPYPKKAAIDLSVPPTADSLYLTFTDGYLKPNFENASKKGIGSNNWAVGPSKTKSGRPILCNDPHLSLSLPAYYYEMQITTPTLNVYGTSFPGIPNILFGYNDSIAFGFTSAARDVADLYEIKFRDSTKHEYWFNGKWREATTRFEPIKIKGEKTFIDTVAYTVFGPVMYDRSYPADNQKDKYLAIRWTAHDSSNDNYMFYLLNHAKNYNDYAAAIKYLNSPGLNCIFASKSGDIAIWHQGEFPAKWKGQGDFIMPGTDLGYMWRGIIPQEENPHMKNPSRGYVSSANQLPADSTYPYYMAGKAGPLYRGYTINRYLESMGDITVEDMKKMQKDNYSMLAEEARKILLMIDENHLDREDRKYLEMYRQWNNRKDAQAKGATVFHEWWQALRDTIWGDDFGDSKVRMAKPADHTLVESLLKDTTYSYLDNINTPKKETLQDQLLASLKKATSILKKKEQEDKMEWWKGKDTRVEHLLQIPAFSRYHVPVGGGYDVINATTEAAGPSWRMIVQLTDQAEAYGIYVGGQSGNPGSQYYDNFIDDWAAGRYYKLWMMKKDESGDKRIGAKIDFSN
jgi:penicillin amidase